MSRDNGASCVEVWVENKTPDGIPGFWLCCMIRTEKKGEPTKDWREFNFNYDPKTSTWSCEEKAARRAQVPSFYFGCMRVENLAAGERREVFEDCSDHGLPGPIGQVKEIKSPSSIYMDILIDGDGLEEGVCPPSAPNIHVSPDGNLEEETYSNWWMDFCDPIPFGNPVPCIQQAEEIVYLPVNNWYLMSYPRVLPARLQGEIVNPIAGSVVTFVLPEAGCTEVQIPIEPGNCFSSINRVPVDLPFVIPHRDTSLAIKIHYRDTTTCRGVPPGAFTAFQGVIVVDSSAVDTTGYYSPGDSVVFVTGYFHGDNDKPVVQAKHAEVRDDSIAVAALVFDATTHAWGFLRYRFGSEPFKELPMRPIGRQIGEHQSLMYRAIPLPAAPAGDFEYRIVAVDPKGNTDSTLATQVVNVEAGRAAGSSGVRRWWPNPARGEVSIGFGVARAGRVTLRVYDLAGRLVAEPVDGWRQAGEHTAVWDGRDLERRKVAAGTYSIRLALDNVPLGAQRMIMLR